MSPKHDSPKDLKTLIKQTRALDLKSSERVAIFSGPSPQAITATAILCRALQRNDILFHVRFVDIVPDLSLLSIYIKQISGDQFVMVGCELSGPVDMDDRKSLVLIGSSQGASEYPSVGTTICAPASAYALAQTISEVKREDLQLAAIGSIIRDHYVSDGASAEVVKLAESDKIVEERKGLKLFGTNFLPLNQVFNLSIYPYIHGLSGNPQACEKILDKADIPLGKRTKPITSLNTKEVQKLTQELMQIDMANKVSVIKSMLGRDYIFKLEMGTSPLLFLSGIIPLFHASWCRWELGMATATMLGDRARMLDEIVSTYKNHSYMVIMAMKQIYENHATDTEDSASSTIFCPDKPVQGISRVALPDVARTLYEVGLVSTDVPIILNSDDGACVSWSADMYSYSSALIELRKAGLNPRSATEQSIILSNTVRDPKDILSLLMSS